MGIGVMVIRCGHRVKKLSVTPKGNVLRDITQSTQEFPAHKTGLERCTVSRSSASMFYQRDSRWLRLLPNENVNEQWGVAKQGERPQSLPGCSCRLIGPRGLVVWPHWTGLCVKDTWSKMDHDILNVWVHVAPFYREAAARKGS